MGGHYVGYKKLFPQTDHKNNTSSMWVLANDEDIVFKTQQQVLQRNAYMLFYERIIN